MQRPYSNEIVYSYIEMPTKGTSRIESPIDSNSDFDTLEVSGHLWQDLTHKTKEFSAS